MSTGLCSYRMKIEGTNFVDVTDLASGTIVNN
jgi:hypothetical protein